jgi:hypothetical protein
MAKRNEPNQDKTLVKPPAGVPSYLAQYVENDKSKDALNQYRVVPRLKIVQGTAGTEIQQKFQPGAIILWPNQAIVADLDRKTRKSDRMVRLQPLVFYTDFCQFADIKDKQSPTIITRSFDPGSEVAQKARSIEGRKEKYGKEDQYTYRFCEHLNFICMIRGEHDLAGEMVAMVFARGEFTVGRNFATRIAMIKAPLWAQLWEITVGWRDRGGDKKWFGIDVAEVPEEDERIIPEEEVEKSLAAHEELLAMIAKQKLIVDHSDREGDGETDLGPEDKRSF